MIPLDDRTPDVEVLEESEGTTGWRCRVAITRLNGARSEHEITLAWVDHDHWTGGIIQPSRLITHLAALVAERMPELPPRFDAAKARRWIPELDDLLMRLR